MKKIFYLSILTVLFSLCTGICQAQEFEAPNYAQIKEEINNSKSLQYYPLLLERYLVGDTLLANEDYRLLYYGYMSSEDYIPYPEKSKAFYDVRRKIYKADATIQVFNEALQLTEKILDNNPFDISAIAVRAISCLQTGDSAQYLLNKQKYDGIMEAISSSGDGETEQSAFHVIDIEHEYEIASHLGLTVVKDSPISTSVEYLQVEENADNIQGIYFNFKQCDDIYRKKYK